MISMVIVLIWLWVKTLAPKTVPQNSWDLWMSNPLFIC